jgi:NOL1/NOP2/fmu family ribosome biogenesis protein
MSTALSEKAFPRWDTDRETALKYLRKEALQNIPAEIPFGFVIVTYQNRPLGFIKNIGSRANNLYPQEWRIRNL